MSGGMPVTGVDATTRVGGEAEVPRGLACCAGAFAVVPSGSTVEGPGCRGVPTLPACAPQV